MLTASVFSVALAERCCLAQSLCGGGGSWAAMGSLSSRVLRGPGGAPRGGEEAAAAAAVRGDGNGGSRGGRGGAAKRKRGGPGEGTSDSDSDGEGEREERLLNTPRRYPAGGRAGGRGGKAGAGLAGVEAAGAPWKVCQQPVKGSVPLNMEALLLHDILQGVAPASHRNLRRLGHLETASGTYTVCDTGNYS